MSCLLIRESLWTFVKFLWKGHWEQSGVCQYFGAHHRSARLVPVHFRSRHWELQLRERAFNGLRLTAIATRLIA